MKTIEDRLFELRDEEYAKFQAKLTPGIDLDNIIGVRVPKLRELAKEIEKLPDTEVFFHELPHKYYDENMLHSILLGRVKPFEKAIDLLEEFQPYIDNWAVCDTLKPKVFEKNKDRLLPYIEKWISSKDTYTCRIGIEFLMNFYLDKDFKAEYLELPASVQSEEYYVNMMIAWYFATALAKQWEATIPYIEENRLEKWTHNKTIQKARESYRISPEQKEYLKSLKL